MENGFSIEFLGFHDGDFNQMRRLTTDQCEEFHRNGVLVVPKAIDVETIAKIRREFHQTLCRYGCDVQDLRTAKNLGKLSSTGGAGGILDIYYESWKMELHEREDLFDIISDLWSQTYCRQDEVLVCDNQMLLKSPYDEKIDLSRYTEKTISENAGIEIDSTVEDGKVKDEDFVQLSNMISVGKDGLTSQESRPAYDDAPSSSRRFLYQHPYGPFHSRQGYMYIDRVCFRLPDAISSELGTSKKRPLQRSLTPHLDCCPHNLYKSEKLHPKWRPIQAFLALTDAYNPNEGGFEACLGHHRVFDEWTKSRQPSPGQSQPACVGEFTPIRPIEDKDVISGMRHIPCGAGDLVLWDYRIPHANSRHNNTDSAREVVYLGYLPDISMNKQYAFEQLIRYQRGNVPIDQWGDGDDIQMCEYNFSPLGRKLMAMDPYESE